MNSESKPQSEELLPNPPRDIVQAINKADKFVKSQHLFKDFIDGTPLTNDIAVWLADFYMQGFMEGKILRHTPPINIDSFMAELQSALDTKATQIREQEAKRYEEVVIAARAVSKAAFDFPYATLTMDSCLGTLNESLRNLESDEQKYTGQDETTHKLIREVIVKWMGGSR